MGSCGLHVHMSAEDFSITTWQNLLLSYKHAEIDNSGCQRKQGLYFTLSLL